ncbi:hypothetical protein Tco_1465032 [Tanacetum coccineum]
MDGEDLSLGMRVETDMLAELSRRERYANIKPDPDLDIFTKVASTSDQEESVVTDYTLKVSGKVTYNGHELNEFVPKRSLAYISQNDVHIGEMTLSRRERDANIKPDPDFDIFMKASSTSGQEESVVTDYTQGLQAAAALDSKINGRWAQDNGQPSQSLNQLQEIGDPNDILRERAKLTANEGDPNDILRERAKLAANEVLNAKEHFHIGAAHK